MSAVLQYIIVFLILAGVICWIIYKLFIKKSPDRGFCSGCALADNCVKKISGETEGNPKSCCGDCEKVEDEKKEG